ncbi:hypothetical protein ACHAXS_002911 [Conticribra weissflogii]
MTILSRCLVASVIFACVVVDVRSEGEPTSQPTRRPFTIIYRRQPTNSPTSPLTTLAPTPRPTRKPYTLIVRSRPTPNPTKQTTSSPTSEPTGVTPSPSINPSKSLEPTVSSFPTVQYISNPPVRAPSKTPTNAPSDLPSTGSRLPSSRPSLRPTSVPSSPPSNYPSNSEEPSSSPTQKPTSIPTIKPSLNPTKVPSRTDTNAPSKAPSFSPSVDPSGSPTKPPTWYPTTNPSSAPSNATTQSFSPSIVPTQSHSPTNKPFESIEPTTPPVISPTLKPVTNPTKTPTAPPTTGPTKAATASPTSGRKILQVGFDPVTFDFEDGSLEQFATNGWIISETGEITGANSAMNSQLEANQSADLLLTFETRHGGRFACRLKSAVAIGDAVSVSLNETVLISFPSPSPVIPLRTNVLAGQSTVTWRYDSKVDGIGTAYVDDVTILPNIEDGFDTGNFSYLDWNANDGWGVDDSNPHDGEFSAHFSGTLEAGATRSLSVTISSVNGALFTLRINADIGMPYDQFLIYVDDDPIQGYPRRTGGYITFSNTVGAGDHTLSFRVSKPPFEAPVPRNEETDGTGEVWLDDFRWSPNPPF